MFKIQSSLLEFGGFDFKVLGLMFKVEGLNFRIDY
jgi:hypothetical protein